MVGVIPPLNNFLIIKCYFKQIKPKSPNSYSTKAVLENNKKEKLMSCFGTCSVQDFWFNWPMGPIVVSTSSSPHHSAKCLFKLSSALSTHSYLYYGTLVCLTTRWVLGFVLMVLLGKRSGVRSYILHINCVDHSSVAPFKIIVNYLGSPFELLCLMKLDRCWNA